MIKFSSTNISQTSIEKGIMKRLILIIAVMVVAYFAYASSYLYQNTAISNSEPWYEMTKYENADSSSITIHFHLNQLQFVTNPSDTTQTSIFIEGFGQNGMVNGNVVDSFKINI